MSSENGHECMDAPLVKKIEPPASLLFVGNSFFFFNNGICRWMRKLLASGPTPVKLRMNMVAINGASLSWHDVESYFRPNAISSYAFDADNRVVFRKDNGPLWDAVILLDSSQGPIHPELGAQFADFARKDAQICRRHGAAPIFLSTWGYADKPGMTNRLAAATIRVANENQALAIPVGFAFERAMDNRPGLNLLIEDKRHPKPEGTYLMACVIAESVLGLDAREFTDALGINDDLAVYLRQTAHATVKDFYEGGRKIGI